MGNEYVEFLTNKNVLLVVNAYIDAMEHTSMDVKAELVHKAIMDKKPKRVAAVLDCLVTKVYQYKRKDLARRQPDIKLKDFVRMMSMLHE